jgi:hypothetical protein
MQAPKRDLKAQIVGCVQVFRQNENVRAADMTVTLEVVQAGVQVIAAEPLAK